MKFGRTKHGVAGTSGTLKDKGRGTLAEFYDSKSGIATAAILALILWWVPYLGPMVAGFMGGRRAGSLFRGIIAGCISCVLVVAIAAAASIGVASLVDEYGEAVREFSPQVLSLLRDLRSYLGDIVRVSGTSIEVDLSTYFLIVALSIIGGVFADQSRRDTVAIVSLMKKMNETPEPRSIRAYNENRVLSFQTFEDYARMSVNTVSAQTETRRPEARTPVAATPVEEAPREPQYEAAQAIHPMTQAAAGTTTSSSVAEPCNDAVPDRKKSVQRTLESDDQYEFL